MRREVSSSRHTFLTIVILKCPAGLSAILGNYWNMYPVNGTNNDGIDPNWLCSTTNIDNSGCIFIPFNKK
uniref:Uncharacterized protein n=1 Tax=Globodera rostochiensis TaxID=31243 RepID=A0A914H6F9_GLORO